jgi:hypothetical protein
VVAEVVTNVVDSVRAAYNTYAGTGGPVKEAAADAAQQKKDRLREVNDEIMHLRNRSMSRGGLSEQERRRWQNLREEREELQSQLHQGRSQAPSATPIH